MTEFLQKCRTVYLKIQKKSALPALYQETCAQFLLAKVKDKMEIAQEGI